MNQKQPKKSGVLLRVLIAAAVLCIAAVMLWPAQADDPVRPSPGTTAPSTPEPSGTAPVETEPDETRPDETMPDEQDPEMEQSIADLGYGLEITDAGGYVGAYMEDGSNEVVSNVMMLVVRNIGEQDVQLADIVAFSGGEEYTFRLTNLAVGERVVLLDLARKPATGADMESASLTAVALFEVPMELYEDTIQITGLNGMLNVKNISETDISGDIYVYYKFAATDIFYGGITFRVRVDGGLKAGELRQIPAGHFSPDNCRIVQVTIDE